VNNRELVEHFEKQFKKNDAVLEKVDAKLDEHTERIVCVETRQKTIWGVMCAIGCGLVTIIGGLLTWKFTGK